MGGIFVLYALRGKICSAGRALLGFSDNSEFSATHRFFVGRFLGIVLAKNR